jgi:multimeric flavodoxin WrbA
MKIIGIASSPHRNGNSVKLLREALRSAKETGAEIEEIYLPDYDIQYCKGCLNCLSGDRCAIPDDLNLLREKLVEADGLILSSPTYALAPNAMMKNFADRIGMYSVYRSLLGDKYVARIATAAVIGARKTAKMLTRIADGFHRNGRVSGILGVYVGHGDAAASLPQAHELGRKMAKDIRTQKKYPFQRLSVNLLNALVLKRLMRKNVLENEDGKMGRVRVLVGKRIHLRPIKSSLSEQRNE